MANKGRVLHKPGQVRELIAYVEHQLEEVAKANGGVGKDLERAAMILRCADLLRQVMRDHELDKRLEAMEEEIERLKRQGGYEQSMTQ